MVLLKELIVGDHGCSYQNIREALEKSKTVSVLYTKILEIGIKMEIPPNDYLEIEKQLCNGNMKTFDALYKFLEHWRSLKSSEAKLETFVNILVDFGLNDCADAVRNKFSDTIDNAENDTNTYNTPKHCNIIGVREDSLKPMAGDNELLESQKKAETPIKINMPEVLFDYTKIETTIIKINLPEVLFDYTKSETTIIKINLPEVLFDFIKIETIIDIPETGNIRKLKNSKYKRIACVFLILLGVLTILFLLAYIIVTPARQSNLPTSTNESSSLIHINDTVETMKINNDFADGKENFRIEEGAIRHVIIDALTSPKLIYNILSKVNTIILDNSDSNNNICTRVENKEIPGADEILNLTNLQKFASFGELCSDIYNMLIKNVIFSSIVEAYLTYTKGSNFSSLVEKIAADSPSNLKSLEIANLCTADISRAFTSTFPILQSPTTLIISCNSVQPEYVDDDETLWDILKRFPNLTHLGLRNLIISESLYRRLAINFKLVKIEVGIQLNKMNFDMNSLPPGILNVVLDLRFPLSSQKETVPAITSMNPARKSKMETCTVKSNFERLNHSCKDFDYTDFA